MAEHKILILTLGTGNGLDNKIEENESGVPDREIFESRDETVYRMANYQLSDTELVPSCFIAEPLIKRCNPEYIVLIGTVRSSWSNFYRYFAQNKSYDTYCELYRNEKKYGKDTTEQELDEIQTNLQTIYRKELFPGKKIQIILMKYGISETEIYENYVRLTQLEQIFHVGDTYHVSFDITHSFRSMPIYNLVILNYFSHVYDYHIQIDHVYYGNLEVSKENNKISPVVDYQELVHLMELTIGVSEFRNTGNAATLLKQIPDEYPKLKEALQKFDWKTQINEYTGIVNSLLELLKRVREPESDDSKFSDICKMIWASFHQQFRQIRFNENLLKTNLDTRPCDMAEIQYFIGKWYYEQRRYGLALATALETLRSYLVLYYLESKGETVTKASYEDENNRKAAVQGLGNLKYCSTKAKVQLENLEQVRKKATGVRNMFAHTLERGEIPDAKETIDQFFEALDVLRDMVMKRSPDLKNIYVKEKRTIVKVQSGVRLLIANNYVELSRYADLKNSGSGNKSIYLLPKDFCAYLQKDQKSSTRCPVKNGVALAEYIATHFELDGLEIYFDEKLNDRQFLHYPSVILKLLGDKEIRIYKYNKQVKTILPKMELEFEIPDVELKGYDVVMKQEPQRI